MWSQCKYNIRITRNITIVKIKKKVIGEYDIDSPPLDTGDEFYLCDIGKIVKIKKRPIIIWL